MWAREENMGRKLKVCVIFITDPLLIISYARTGGEGGGGGGRPKYVYTVGGGGH